MTRPLVAISFIGVAIGMGLNLVGIPGPGRPKARRGRLAGSLPHITFILGVIFSIVLMVRKELPESTRHMSRGP